MMSFSIVIATAMILIGVIYLVSTKHHINNFSKDNIKYDEELDILDNIIHKAKLRNQGKSIDAVIENLKNHDIKINFNIDFGEKNEIR